MNKKTVALTLEQYKEIISTMQKGFTGLKPNRRIAAALQLEANLGLRISDIVRLRPLKISLLAVAIKFLFMLMIQIELRIVFGATIMMK